MENAIKVTMLGEYTFWEAGMARPCVVSLTGRSRRLWMLVAYLIMHRDRGVPAQELIDLFWPDAEGANPMSTLQNNISRARSALAELGLADAKRLIVCENGLYRWAPHRETTLDSDVFEQRARHALEQEIPQSGLPPALEAAALYCGDFLPECSMEFWCAGVNTYYRSLYLSLCRKAVAWLMEENRTVEAERLCSDVLRLDSAAEEFSVYLMRALILNKNPKKALEHYEYICQMYREYYGVVPGPEIEAEKAEAVRVLYGQETDERELGAFLSVADEESGAFFCENNVFREIVKRQLRELRRSQTQAQILMVRLNRDDLSPERRIVFMKQLENTLTAALRAGDPFTKIGFNRYMVLLSGATYENAEMVVQRILDRLRRDYRRPAQDYSVRIADLEHIKEMGTETGRN